MVLQDFSQPSGQESNMNRENVVIQLLPLQGCPVGDAQGASAAAWAGRSATHGKKNHFFSPSQFIKKMRLLMRFEVIHVITLFAGLKQERYNACPHKAVCMNSFVLSESKAGWGRYLSLLRTGETAIL